MVHVSALDGQLNDVLSHTGAALFYLLIWGLVFAGTALFLGVFIPFITGDSLLFGSGLVAASTGNINIVILVIGTGIAAFLGDQVGFLLGRHYGRGYLGRHGGRRTQAAIIKTESFYRKFGWWSVVIARFMPWARVFVPVVAGVGRMNYYKFLTSNLLGALSWGVGLTLIGYYAATLPGVKSAAYIIAGVLITASIIVGIRTWRIDRAQQRADAFGRDDAQLADPLTTPHFGGVASGTFSRFGDTLCLGIVRRIPIICPVHYLESMHDSHRFDSVA